MTPIEQRLTTALRNTAQTIDRRPPVWSSHAAVRRRVRKRPPSWRPMLAAAAVLLLIVGLVVVRNSQPSTSPVARHPQPPAELGDGNLLWPSVTTPAAARTQPVLIVEQFAAQMLGWVNPLVATVSETPDTATMTVSSDPHTLTVKLTRFEMGWWITAVGDSATLTLNGAGPTHIRFNPPTAAISAVLLWRNTQDLRSAELSAEQLRASDVPVDDVVTVALLVFYDGAGAAIDAVGQSFVDDQGVASTLPGVPATTVLTSPPTPVVIPEPSGPGDTRTPIQRYIGVPADPAAAEQWAWTRTQNLVDTCMTDRGWSFTTQPFELRSTKLENGDYVNSLPAGRQAAYNIDRWGGPGHPEGSCSDEASRRAFAMNALPAEYKAMQDVIDADLVLVEPLDRLQACYAGADPKTLPAATLDACIESSGYGAAMNDATERAESAFVQRYSTQLDLLKGDFS